MKIEDFREMINDLADEFPDAEVVVAKDAEGNSFSPLDDCVVGMYIPGTNEVYGDFFTEDDFDENEDDLEYDKNAIVLWPMN